MKRRTRALRSTVNRRKVTQAKFELVIAKFESRESGRAQVYPMALRLRDTGFEVEADLLILATWNFAGFRYVMRTFNVQHFRDAIEQTTAQFQRLRDQHFQTANFDALAKNVTTIYDAFKPIAKQTGASKIIHLRQPHLFVMWDTDIRKNYGFANRSSANDYLEFQKALQLHFGHISWSRTDKTLPKAIDEYNYLTAHPE